MQLEDWERADLEAAIGRALRSLATAETKAAVRHPQDRGLRAAWKGGYISGALTDLIRTVQVLALGQEPIEAPLVKIRPEPEPPEAA